MKINVNKRVEVSFLQAKCGVRYWEDATVNGMDDEEGKLIPCRKGDYWCPLINLKSGQIINWEEDNEADIHYKVCDDGEYQLINKDGDIVKNIEGYVPEIMYPKENGYGDYVIMEVDKNGFIKDWKVTLNEFAD